MNTNYSSKIANIAPNAQLHELYEAEEGGLNLSALKEILWRRLPLITCVTAVVSSLAFVQAMNRTPIYQSSFEILSEPVTIETTVTSSSRETTEAVTSVKLDDVQIKTLKSPGIIDSVIKQLQPAYPEINYASIISTLDLESANEEETVLEVTYKHPDSKLVKDVLDTLATVYLDYSLQKRQSGLSRGLEFLDQQIPILQAKVDRLNLQIQQIRQKHNFIKPEIQGENLSVRLEDLTKEQLLNKSQLNQAKWNDSVVQKEVAQEPTKATTAMQFGTDRYNKLLEDLRGVDRQIANKSAIFTNGSAELQVLFAEKKEILSLIDQEGKVVEQKLANQISSLEEQNKDIDQDIIDLKQEIKDWSGVTQDYEEIQRQITITVRQLNELLVQRESLKIESAQKEAPWRLLTAVGDPQTDSASTVNFVVLGTLFGLLVGVGLALALDKYQNIVHTSSQLKRVTDLPILGMIPFDRSSTKSSLEQEMSLLMKPDSIADKSAMQVYKRNSALSDILTLSIEPFRFFGANLGLFAANSTLRSFIITSAMPGEGKSTVALNLAKTAAIMGKRVLLVDTDMRSISRISKSIPLANNFGLTDLVLKPNLDLRDVVQKSFLEENLFILSSGSQAMTTDPGKLFVSKKITEVMKTAEQNFDLVIYDVSSIVNYADVSLLATKTDGVVLVTGLGKLQNVNLKEAMNRLNVSNIPVLGIVVNELMKRN
ncbi:GumC family protein [Pleurocapsa sp. FMAR1]|uniref:GumC family protein n=1 Tax=Pleurocapsa sp. FMAR1 TaxID=3040204 RepID=UPI0029C6CF40|nr:AAA family ATPase [Pleurocapsa sp. FMAR1]